MIDHPTPDQPRIALAHDWLCGFRGGEAVLDRIAGVAGALGEVEALYTMFDDGRPLAPSIDRLRREPSFLSRGPAGARRWLLPLYPAAVDSLSRRLARRHRATPIDLLLSTSSAAIKGMRAPPGIPHLCYCHAPARYIWTIADEYGAGGGPADALRRAGLRAARRGFRRWDRRTAANVTRFLANSRYTAERILACFGRESEVVHPPARTGFFTPDSGVEREDFWLLASALEPYKRVDLAIEAASLAGARLVIVGTGSMEAPLRARPGGAEVLGRVSDEKLRDLYRRARLLVFPQIEDFGITAVEAQACGCPVVARGVGGALDTVIEGTTGSFFADATPAAIVSAAKRCPSGGTECVARAEGFSEPVFDRAIERQIRLVLEGQDRTGAPTS